MENPTPQLEDGYLKIANDIVRALARKHLNSYQNRILWAIFIKTYGYNKKEDWISNSQFVEITGIKASHVSRAVSELLAMNIVTKRGNKIAFQKIETLWKELPNGVRRHDVTNRGNSFTNRGNSVTKRGVYKIQYTKDNIQNTHSLYGSLKNLDESVLQEIADKYQVPLAFVLSKKDDLQNYCDSRGKRYKNYKATLMNWVKADALKIKQKMNGQSKIAFIGD